MAKVQQLNKVKAGNGATEKNIIKDRISDLQGKVCYISQEVMFLSAIFTDPMSLELDEAEFTGLGQILEHITGDLSKVLDGLDALDREKAPVRFKAGSGSTEQGLSG